MALPTHRRLPVATALLATALAACIHEVRRPSPASLLPPHKVAVIGEVGRAGLIDWQPGMTALDALRAAGGLAPSALPDSAVLTRMVSGLTASTTLHLARIASAREPDPLLLDGDVIQVPGLSTATD